MRLESPAELDLRFLSLALTSFRLTGQHGQRAEFLRARSPKDES